MSITRCLFSLIFLLKEFPLKNADFELGDRRSARKPWDFDSENHDWTITSADAANGEHCLEISRKD